MQLSFSSKCQCDNIIDLTTDLTALLALHSLYSYDGQWTTTHVDMNDSQVFEFSMKTDGRIKKKYVQFQMLDLHINQLE